MVVTEHEELISTKFCEMYRNKSLYYSKITAEEKTVLQTKVKSYLRRSSCVFGKHSLKLDTSFVNFNVFAFLH